jgi:hypothetical protein
MTYSKKDISFVTKKLHELLKTHPSWIVLKKLKGMCALYETEGNKVTITIDPRKDILPSLIHEALHHWYPDWPESRVEKHERLIVNALTPSQTKNIIISLASIL